jgi:RND family efflux transporter MFP subunit
MRNTQEPPLPPSDLSQMRIERGPGSALGRARRWPWMLGAAAILALAGFAVRQTLTFPADVATAAVGTAYPYQAVTLLNAAGYVVAQRKAAVSSKATGRLEWLGVQEGSRVKRDEIIARLENRDVRAQADQAQANVAVAKANVGQAQAELQDAEVAWRRASDLMARRFIAQSAADTAEARLAKAKAALASGRAALQAAQAAHRVAEVAADQTLIRAPFDGVVLTKSANVGDVVTPFSSALDAKGAVVSMADMGTLEVEADVSESNLAKIQVGQFCEIQLDAFPEQRFRGRVSRLVPTVDRAKASVMTKVSFVDHDDRILPEMSAKVAFLSQEVAAERRRPFTVVDPAAVVGRGGSAVVFVVADGKARERPVQTGEKLGDSVAITGVEPGERVVLRPDAGLKDGAAVTVKKD